MRNLDAGIRLLGGLDTAAEGYPWALADVPIEERGPDVVAPPPLIYLGPLLAGLALDRFLPLPRLPAALRGAGLPLLAGGIGLGGWFIASMRRAGTPVDPYQPPTALVENGPFRFTRNPAYLGFALAYAGISLLAGGRWPLVFLPGVLGGIDRGVMAREEAYLQERFGAPYRDYRSRVRRWL
ncbi:MAG TPA: isoprenylcysteine carboxylmethyltransferase family protein [Chloroflexota bacterium]|nr:isoprenylcysteine carboxylmethyltransferase family protein [Chloroflexota bacterium]